MVWSNNIYDITFEIMYVIFDKIVLPLLILGWKYLKFSNEFLQSIFYML